MAQHKALKDAIREKANRERLMKMMHEQMKSSYQRGLLVGSRSMLKVIGDKIAEMDKTPEERLAEVMKIINNLLGMTDQTEAAERDKINELIEEKQEVKDEVLSRIIDKATEIREEDKKDEDDDE
ncbi:MAG: hypothetical protein II712_02630 [Erysipelotrichaceae bacterium]|nr:hypothetical protein [Erysipelotrichaceae bacterium]